MSTLIIAIMGVALASVFALVVINRESREVVSAALPVFLGAMGAILLVFAYTRPAPISRAFQWFLSWSRLVDIRSPSQIVHFRFSL